MSIKDFGKMKFTVYREVKKTNPNFKFSQMRNIKVPSKLEEYMEEHNIDLSILDGFTANQPHNTLNKKTKKKAREIYSGFLNGEATQERLNEMIKGDH